MSVHIRVVLDTRKALKRPSSDSGEDFYPVRLRVTYDRKRRYHKTTLPSLTQKDWKKVQLGVRMTQRQREVFHGIREIEAKAHEIVQELNPFSFAVFKTRFFGNNTSSSNNLIDMFKAHISKLEEEERISTASSYQCALNSLMSYRKAFNWNDLHPEFFEGYESFMLEQGKKQNTIGIYLRSLRTIVNQGKGLEPATT